MKKLKPDAFDWAQIERFLASADKKLASARNILAFDEEACLQQAYEAILKARWGSCSARKNGPVAIAESGREIPSIHRQGSSRHPGRFIARQIDRQSCDILRSAKPADGMCSGSLLTKSYWVACLTN